MLFSSLLSAVARGGVSALRQQTRNYTQYSAILCRAAIKPTTPLESRAIVRNHFDVARQQGFFQAKPGLLRLIVGPEFGFNGRYNGGDIVADGSDRIAPDIYHAAVLEAQEQLRKEEPGAVYISPTAMIDTGQLLDGKPVVENRGFVISSGPESDVMEHTKKNVSSIDGVEEGVTVVGDGPVVYRARDLSGGSDRWLAVAICLDYARELAAGKVHSPLGYDLIVCPSAGFPGGVPKRDVDVVVNDTIHNTFKDLTLDDTISLAGSWEVVERDPALKKVTTWLSDPKSLAYPFVGAMGLTSFVEAALKSYSQPERVLTPLPYWSDGVTCIRVDPQDLPTDPSYVEMAKTIAAVDGDGADLVTGGMGRSEIEALAKTARTVGADLPWDYIHDQLKDRIDREIGDALTELHNPFAMDPAALTATLDTTELRATVNRVAGDLAWAAGAADPAMSDVTKALGEGGARLFFATVSIDKFVTRLGEGDAGGWIRAAIEQSAVARRAHASAENAAALSDAARSAADASRQTASELAAVRQAFSEADAAAKAAPTDAERAKRRDELQAEVDRKVAESVEAERASEEATNAESAAESREERDRSAKEEAGRKEAEAAHSAFGE